MKTLNDHIKTNEYKNVYLLYGPEDYLVKQYKEKLISSMIDADDNMNFSHYEGKGISVEDLVETAQTLPFFAERRVILIENSGYLKSAPEMLLTHMDEFPESTYLIFAEKEVDKRSKLYKKIKSSGYDAEMKTPDEKTLAVWIKGKCKDEQKLIEDQTIYYFIENMGSDMSRLSVELEKLFSYTIEEDKITKDDVDAVCVNQAENKIFDMLDAIGSKNQSKALSLYQDLIELREPSIRILFLITRQFRILMIIRKMMDEKKSSSEMASAAEVPPFTVKKYMAQAEKLSYETLKSMLMACQETEAKIKTGEILDVVGVETLIISFVNMK